MKFHDFLIRQPGYPDENENAGRYYEIAERLLNKFLSLGIYDYSGSLFEKIALTLTDYLQDIVADGGLWRSFVDMNRKLYGWSVPFHTISEAYIDYELNLEDVRFLVWYIIAMLDIEHRDIYPHSSSILNIADAAFGILEESYDDAPIAENWCLSPGLEMHDPDDQEKIMRLAMWLFNSSYLLTPAFALDLHDIVSEVASNSSTQSENNEEKANEIRNRMQEAFVEMPTGPLALYALEWVNLIVRGKLPAPRQQSSEAVHPYYEPFVAATDGNRMKIFSGYEDMNQFFIDKLGWEKGKEYLSAAKGATDYVLLVDKHKGMLMARDIARCIKSPDNHLYDAEFARRHTFDLLTVRGLCPADLYHYISEQGWWSPASFPNSDDTVIVEENRDFIARCYLQQYYRGD